MMCEDINECSLNPSLCGPGRCVNTPGGYECQCPRDYMLAPDGQQCVDMRKEMCFMRFSPEDNSCSAPMSQPQTRLVCCCSMGAGWGRQCEQCPPASSSEYTELCGGGGPGQIVDPITGDLTEIDECKMMQVGGQIFLCYDPHINIVMSLCQGICQHGTCMNTLGSYRCDCEPGYTHDEDSHQVRSGDQYLAVPD